MAAVKDKGAWGLDNWDYEAYHVQTRNEINTGRFMSSQQVLICAGPPILAATSRSRAGGDGLQTLDNSNRSESDIGQGSNAETVFPIGVLEVASLQQQRAVQQIFEIGSKKKYMLPGNHFGSLSLQRIMLHGPSLLRVSYAFYDPSRILPIGGGHRGISTLENDDTESILKMVSNAVRESLGPEIDDIMPVIRTNPGFNSQYFNLGSSLFDQPTGFAFFQSDSRKRVVSAFYVENCQVSNHSYNVQANNTILMEGATFEFTDIVPINVIGFNTSSLVSTGLASGILNSAASLAGGFGIPSIGL